MEENSCKGKEIPENQEIDEGEELLIGGKLLYIMHLLKEAKHWRVEIAGRQRIT
jgi:hypothetical protein